MNVMLATEPTTQPAEKPAAHPYLETWAQNEPMRHIPPISWIVQKVDVDVRRRALKLAAAFAVSPADHPLHAPIDEQFKGLCRALDRLAEIARHGRNSHPPNDLQNRVSWAVTHAVAHLNMVDANTFGRRFPAQTFERSKAEPLYAALLIVLQHLERLTKLIRQIDGGIDELLLEGIVVLENPVDQRMLQPIA